MSAPAILLSLLFGTSVITTIAMAVAWVHFGRQKHVLTWTLSYAIATVQWVTNAAGFFLQSRLFFILTAICLIASSSLLAIGVRQRSGRPFSPVAFIVPAVMVSIATAMAIGPMASQTLQGMIIPTYVGILLSISALSLRPRGRAFTPPELAFFCVLIAFVACQLSLAGASAMIRGPEEGKDLYRQILSLVMPTIYVGTAVSAVLVVAGDLAEQLRKQMRHDPLTNVLNRRGIDEAALRAIAQARRHGRALALVVCDLDGFKALNDGFGHIAGDNALRSFAQLLSFAVRRGDIVGRMGGDEFGLLLIDTQVAAAAEVMERVRQEMAEMTVAGAPGHMLGASFGVAELEPGDKTLEDMVARADAALYRAKRQGKNQVSIAHASAA